MSPSPFMTPDRRRRHPGRWRGRGGKLAAVIGVLALAIAAAVVVLALASSGRAHRSSPVARKAQQPAHVVAAAQQPRSPSGLVLGKPPLTLSGLRDPQADPVQLIFHQPPRAGLLFDLDSGRVLWQRNPERRMPIASLTKMMTALLTVQSAPSNARVLVTRRAEEAPGSRVGLLPLGKDVRLRTMLYGLLLPSGNDAAVALAQHVAHGVKRFVSWMNDEAAKLGLGCTRYSSPSGYYNHGNFSCAADLAVLAHVDLEQPRIASVVRTSSAALPFPIKGGKLYLYNNNPLLIYGYPGLTGLKTGYTVAAGKCLVATAERHGVRLGVVLLNSPDPGTQARQLLDNGFERVYHQAPEPEPPIPAGV
jgi:serine-type D-Ala-D-Ala carboxypeptidase (penicillin-binding protein 5/6)